MGWITNAAPGTKYGPCKKPCKHKDCEAARIEASTECYLCHKPIGYETKFYCDTFYGDAGELTGRTYRHFLCAIREAEAKRRQEKRAERDETLSLGMLGPMP
jgi:hypothetical protein